MVRFLTALSILLALTVSFASAGPDGDVFTFENVSTSGNTTAQTNKISTPVWVEGIYVDLLGYASPTVDVDVVALDGRTIYSANSLTADTYLPVREAAVTTAGVAIANTETKIPLWPGKFEVFCGNAGTTGVTVSVKVLLSR